MGNFWLFLKAVADQWTFWIGLLLMIEPYLEVSAPQTWKVFKDFLAKKPERRKKIFRIAGAVALFVACFQAWDAQYEEVQTKITAQTIEPLAKRLAMKELIENGISRGGEISQNWSTKDADSFLKETNRWTNQIGQLVEDAYGKGEASLVMNDAGYTNYSNGTKQMEYANWITRRSQRLNELMTRIDSLQMRPDFDPVHYHWADPSE